MSLRLWIATVLLGLTGCQSCEESTVPEAALPSISTEVQFASVKQLGPHRMSANIHRKDERGGQISIENDETLVLIWQDEDFFDSKVIRDGEIQSQVVVSEGVPYSRRRDGSWVRKEDAEPVRVGIYTTWNVWENALDLYNDRIVYSDPVADVYEGRDVRRYTVSLSDAEASSKRAARRKRRDGEPILLDGYVWLDGQTAVRLKAEVTGVWRKAELEKTVQLSMARTDVGQTQLISAPLEGGDQQR
jgi:hypothetical protein